MTDKKTKGAPAPKKPAAAAQPVEAIDAAETAATAEAAEAADSSVPGSPANKKFWAGIGVGSAALVAALMYAKRPKRRK